MRKIISTLLLSLVLLGLANATVVFDPATYPTAKLKSGMTVVTIDGKAYLQVVLDGWNSSLDIAPYQLLTGQTTVMCTFKYKKGASNTRGIDTIQAAVQIIDTTKADKIPASWDPTQMVNSSSAVGDLAGKFSTLKVASATIVATQKWVNSVQFSGQERTGGWGPVTGDTMWVSKVEVYDPTNLGIATVFNPATFPVDKLKSGMSIVTIGSKKYLKVVLDGWNSALDIPAYPISANEKNVKCSFRYVKGTTNKRPADTIQAAVQIIDTVKADQVKATWDPFPMVNSSTAVGDLASKFSTLKEASAAIVSTQKWVNSVQFSGQERAGGWGAVIGDTMYVGQIDVYDPNAAPVGPFDLTTFKGTVPDGTSLVVEGADTLWKVTVTGWNAIFDIATISTGSKNKFACKMRFEKGTYTGNIDSIRGSLQLMNATVQTGINSLKKELSSLKTDMPEATNYTQVQLFAQYIAGSWAAQDGINIYVSKLKLTQETPTLSVVKNKYSAKYLPAKEIIISDGKVDADEYWKSVTAADINRQALPSKETPKITDSKGTFKASWDEDYLYLLIDATDPNVIMYDNAATDMQSWNNDGTELFVDVRNRHFVGSARISSEQHQLRFNVGRTGADTSAINFTGSYKTKYKYGAEWGMPTIAGGWRLEVQLPWANLSRNAIADSAVAKYLTDSIKAGKKIAFEISVVNASAKNTRVSIMNWANDQKDDRAYPTNEFYGELVLLADVVSVKKSKVAQLTVSPNPAVDVVVVSAAGLTGVEIYSILGQKVASASASGDAAQVSVSSLKKGAYIVKADVNGASVISKLVKK